MRIVFLDEATVTLNDIDFASLKALGSYEGYSNTARGGIVDEAALAEALNSGKKCRRRCGRAHGGGAAER